MKSVGVKVLKDNLSRYLRCVREGETVYVTDRDTIVAEMHSPVHPIPQKVGRWEAFLNEEERRGSVRRGVLPDPSIRDLARTCPRPANAPDLQSLLDAVKES